MTKSRIAFSFVVAVGLLIAIFAISSGVAAYHCARCGSERWERSVLWIDMSEPDYDEFGIEDRWEKAHRHACDHVWVPGLLEADSHYWYPLELAVAKGESVRTLEVKLSVASLPALRQKDAFGRTIMHWLAIHPDLIGRARLIHEMEARGMTMTEKDADGLSPLEWQSNSSK